MRRDVVHAITVDIPYVVCKMSRKKRRGLVHVYTGDGKGKTTVAVGLALRAVGHGMSVYMIQFLKGGRHVGEIIAADDSLPNFKIKQFGKPCPYSQEMKKGNMECGNCKDCFLSRKEEKEKVSEAMDLAEKIVKSGKYDVVILDEINNTVNRKLVSNTRVIKLIKTRKPSVEVVLTGRNATREIMELGDYVTVMKKIKHPFTKGIRVRFGVDY
jgi:cob(I)alamin adenosyltransferase